MSFIKCFYLGYIPKILNVDETTLRRMLFAYRFRNGLTNTVSAKRIKLGKNTISRFEKNFLLKKKIIKKVFTY
jgi:hypothetical protein